MDGMKKHAIIYYLNLIINQRKILLYGLLQNMKLNILKNKL